MQSREARDYCKDFIERTHGAVNLRVIGLPQSGKTNLVDRFFENFIFPRMNDQRTRDQIQYELQQVNERQNGVSPYSTADISLSDGSSLSVRVLEQNIGANEEVKYRADSDDTASNSLLINQETAESVHLTSVAVVVVSDSEALEWRETASEGTVYAVIKRLINEKVPFVILLNSVQRDEQKQRMLESEYNIPVIAIDAECLDHEDISRIMEALLLQFPVKQAFIQTPEWLSSLDGEHWLINSLEEQLKQRTTDYVKMNDIGNAIGVLAENPHVDHASEMHNELGSGKITLQILLKEGLFNQILAEQCGTEIKSDAHLLSLLCELVNAKREYDGVAQALKSVKETGYGVVSPIVEEMSLQEPEIMRQGKHFGVRLKASAPSLHMIRVDVQTEVSPVVGTEEQSEAMIRYLMDGFEQDPQKLWQSNLFGKPLSDLVREGLATKLMHMPPDIQSKMQQALGKIINEGSGGMICILL